MSCAGTIHIAFTEALSHSLAPSRLRHSRHHRPIYVVMQPPPSSHNLLSMWSLLSMRVICLVVGWRVQRPAGRGRGKGLGPTPKGEGEMGTGCCQLRLLHSPLFRLQSAGCLPPSPSIHSRERLFPPKGRWKGGVEDNTTIGAQCGRRGGSTLGKR